MESVVENFQREITRVCERTLGRRLAEHERRFIECRQSLIALESIHDYVKSMEAVALQRYLASERSTGPVPVPAEPHRPGHYLGTVVDGKWWKRYRKDGLFARGNGEWWIADGQLYFRRLLTKQPIVIPLSRSISVGTGTWHAGRWGGGKTIIKLTWVHAGRRLTAGFVLAAAAAESQALMEKFRSEGVEPQRAKD